MASQVALIGARGYVGAELMALLAGHGGLELAIVSSRELVGQRVRDHIPAAPPELYYVQLEPQDVARHADIDAWILALPNGLAAPWVAAIDVARPEAVIIDLSTDFRAATVASGSAWVYGLPERNRARLAGARRIANPGCYATGVQLGLVPILDTLAAPAHAFGISGYSGAGTTPSSRNDPEALRDNLMPYALSGHAHEREVREQLGHRVHFMPHVAPFFRGITLTLSFEVVGGVTAAQLVECYRALAEGEPLVSYSDAIPLVRDVAHHHGICIGGLAFEPSTGHGVVVVTLDNLLKGAATQAVQNLNLALGLSELQAIPVA